jgi:hypothetical protein
MAQLGTAAAILYYANMSTNPEAYKEITDRDKEANFIITTPLYFTDDKGQKRYWFMKIAKDQGQRVFTTAIEALMSRYFEGKYPTKQVLQSVNDLVNVVGMPPTLAAGFSYMLNKDTWTMEDVWKGPKGIASKEEYRKDTHPFWVSVGQKTGLSPERLSNAASKIVPMNNPFTGLVGSGYKAITGNLSQDVQDKSMEQIVSEIGSVRRVFSTTSPYAPYKEGIEKAKEDEVTRRFIQNRKVDELSEKYLRTKDRGTAKELVKFVRSQPEEDQDRLEKRFERTGKFYKLPDRTWWVNTSELPAEARAVVFYDRFTKATPEEKKQMIGIARKVGGFESDKFDAKLDELISADKKARLSAK